MYGILFRVVAKSEEFEKLRDFLKWDGDESRKGEQEGLLRFEVYRDPENEYALYVYEAYRDQQAFKEHQKGKPYHDWLLIEEQAVTKSEVLFKEDPLSVA